mmetsp:Transcript_5206/g.15925  ORF Transcript_5206/g.15925 Transcript_5206/m.15925 type:complete len:169 (+) Transcript_5206:43-549(+)
MLPLLVTLTLVAPPLASRRPPTRAAVRCRLPESVAEAIGKWSANFEASEVEALWKALRKCYPSEEAALQAVRQNANVICPLFATPTLIQQTYRVLIDELGKEDAIKVLQMNPSVLTCGDQLRGVGADEIMRAARVRRSLDAIPSEAFGGCLALVVAAIAYRLATGVGP